MSKPNEELKLILNSQPHAIPQKFKMMGVISDDIFNSLTKNKQYVVQSKVSTEVFEEFILYLTEGKLPEVHIDNLFELQQLSVEFCTDDIKQSIHQKIDKWREIEAKLEQGTLSNSREQELQTRIDILEQSIQQFQNAFQHMQQNMQDLHDAFQKQSLQLLNKIEALETEVKNQSILNQAELDKMNENQTLIDDKISELQAKITDEIENKIKNDIEIIKQDILDNESTIHAQASKVQKNSSLIEDLENQNSSLKNEVSNTKEQINQNVTNSEFKSNILTIEKIKNLINEIKSNYISKDVLIFLIINQIHTIFILI